MASNWQVGDRIENRWQIHDIKRGGMGIVYIVYDHEFHEPFAIKTFQDETFARNPIISERFKQEALVWINLDNHQNVTRAHFMESIEGNPFLFLEYVSGGDLGDWIGTPRLTEDISQVLSFAIQFCDGMSHASSKGIKVHRDIKPQNCLITEDNTLKVTDFGLAKVFNDIESKRVDEAMPNPQSLQIGLSRSGASAGTCTHMAPEQFIDAKHVDVRADIYSFGVMLFQMVTGDLPFVGRTWQEFESLHKTQSVPSHRIKNPALRLVIETCLAKDPRRRFADFGVVRVRLAEIYKQITGRPAPKPLAGAELNAVQLSNKGLSLNRLGQVDDALVCYDRALKADPRNEKTWSNKGSLLWKLKKQTEALACFDHALAINPGYSIAWFNKGSSLYELRRNEEALACYDRALAINPRFDYAWFRKGVVLEDLKRFEEAITAYNQCLAINPRDVPAWSNKSGVFRELGQMDHALECFDRALAINQRDAAVWFNKGALLIALGKFDKALECLEEAQQLGFPQAAQGIAQCQKMLSAQNADAWLSKGVTLGNSGQLEAALNCFEQVLRIEPRHEQAWRNKQIALEALGRYEDVVLCYDHYIELNPRDVVAWGNKGMLLRNLGRVEEAFACYDRALEINPLDADVWVNKGVAWAALGKGEEAISCFDRALAIDPCNAAAWYNEGAVLGPSGRFPEALTCFKLAQQHGYPGAEKGIAQCLRAMGRK